MKKVYNTPELEIKKFDLLTDILDDWSDPETTLPTTPGSEVEIIRGEFKIDSSGFGW